MRKKSFINIQDIVYIHKGKLHIDLGKLRLTICPEIFITIASGKLEVAIASGTH